MAANWVSKASRERALVSIFHFPSLRSFWINLPKHQPDAITLDLLMQPVHGLEVLLQLKNDPRTSKIPVIIVTIVDQPGVGSALGADEYLIKPVDKATLLAAVERCLKSRGGAAPARSILVVEDD